MPYKDGKKRKEYIKVYMRDYRKRERDLIRLAKQQFGFTIRKKKKRDEV